MSEQTGSEQAESGQAGTAVVTGGGTGIGRAIARALTERGDRVVIVGRRPDRLESAAKDINAEVGGPPVLPFAADVTDPDQVERLAGFVTGEFGTLDVLVNNAGGTHSAPVTSLHDLATRHTTLYLQNVVSALLVTQALGPAIRRPGGRIIMISSRSARSAGGDPGYAATKAALNRLVVGLANDYGPGGVTVNAVAPGYVPDTELYSGAIPAEWHERIVAGISVGRGGPRRGARRDSHRGPRPRRAGFVVRQRHRHRGRRRFATQHLSRRSERTAAPAAACRHRSAGLSPAGRGLPRA